MKRRLSTLLVLALAIAIVMPGNALAFTWRVSPSDPLIVGGVHTKGSFKYLFLHRTKVIGAVKAVLSADGVPSWVYSAAVARVNAGGIHSDLLPIGSRIGAMAFGPTTTKIALHTVWEGTFELPYYYVSASNVVVTNGVQVTTTYKVCLAKTCGNPFVLGPIVTRKQLLYRLFLEKRMDSVDGTRLAGWEVTGTVGAKSYDLTTTDTAATQVGSFAGGTTYHLGEVLQLGWQIVSPSGGTFTGTMPTHDVTLTFVNQRSIVTDDSVGQGR